MNMKKLISSILALSMCLSLAACSSSDSTASTDTSSAAASTATDSADSGEVTQIEFWYAWTDEIEENNLYMAELFNETIGKEKGIEVTPVYQGNYVETHQKLQAAYIAGEAPAISVMEIASVGLFADNGIIKSLDDLIAQDSFDADNYFPGLMENCIVDDSYYALPYMRSTPIMYVNSSLLEEAGLNPAGPATWDEFAEYCYTLNEDYGIVGSTLYSYLWTMEAFFLTRGESILSEDEMTTNINSEVGHEIFEFFLQLIDDGVMSWMTSAEGSTMMNANFSNQDCAMIMSSTGNLTNMQVVGEENGFDISASYLPMGTQYGVPTGGCNLVMTTGLSAEEEAAAWEFLKFITDTEQVVYTAAYTGYVITSESALATDEAAAMFEEVPGAEIALAQLQSYGYGRPMNTNYTEFESAVLRVIDAILVDGADIDETLAAAEIELNAILQQ